MLVNFYEKNSQNLHRYNAPSYLTGMGSSPMQAVSEGYITMLPDVHFHTGSSHSDMLECVEAAMSKVIEMGYVDPKRIGINGHSYGGEGAAFIGTRSTSVRGRRHGRRRDRPLQRLQPELGLVLPGDGRQRRQRQRLLPLRPGPLGRLAVGQPRDLSLRVGAHARAAKSRRRFSSCTAPRTRPCRSPNGIEFLQRAALQQQERRAAGLPGRGTRAARAGESQGPDDSLLPVLQSLPEGRARRRSG